ncbi:O-antigen ligase [Leifsonia sp. TF02-11]|uniref:O-antigen ligase family protein n=1 Tax=Leifsonia sp. TF02-11 TaxID=2815212 RepID=UPI001AA1437C|nr:O-antigen ligase family protein [Leifsonia sp. TF02-11]MBO1739143.1 O-antigen ligase family protein [Leifsonia sp. TF02-11]
MSTTSPSTPATTAEAAAAADARAQAGYGVTALTVYLVLLYAVPSSLSISSLGSAAGRPATMWALFCTLGWMWYQLQRTERHVGVRQPLRYAAAGFAVAVLASYSWAMLRGIPTNEVTVADNGVIRTVALLGIVVTALDGILTANGLITVLRRLATLGGLMATLGIAQFTTGDSLLGWLAVPGMSDDALAGVDTRGGFIRASGTATHPLEYGVVLAAAFPVALTFALRRDTRHRALHVLNAAVIAVAILLSVSRSAIIGLVAALLVLFVTWPWKRKLAALVTAAVGVTAIGFTVPGMLGTLRGLFGGISTDTSTVSRIDGFASALEFFQRFPVVGKGFGTFLPVYYILDNEYFVLAIELGIVGLLAVAALLGFSVWSAATARRTAVTELQKELSQALVAAVVATGVLFAFFDGLTFPMAAGTLFVLFGLCGAARRTFRPSAAGPLRADGRRSSVAA